MDKYIKHEDHMADRAAMATAVLEVLDPGERPCDCERYCQCGNPMRRQRVVEWNIGKKAYDEVSAILEAWGRK